MVRMILRQFWIRIHKNKSLTIITLFGLTFSLTCCLLISLWVKDEYSVDAFHKNGSQIYQVFTDYKRPDGSIVTKTKAFYPVKDLLDNNVPGILNTVILNKNEIVMSVDNINVKSEGYYASNNFFEVFSFPLVAGSSKNLLKDNYCIALSESSAIRLFPGVGYDQIIGKSLNINDKAVVMITGIFKDVGHQSSLQFDFILPMELNLIFYPWNDDFGNHNHLLFAQIPPEVSIDGVGRKTNAIVEKLMGTNPNKPKFWFYPFEKIYLHSNISSGIVQGGRIDYIKIFVAVAVLVLILSIINFTNLTIARNSKYLKEVAIRKYMGSSRLSLISSIYFDTLCIVTISFVFAVLLVVAIEPAFNQLTAKEISLDFSNLNNWWVALLVITVIVIIAGLYPALAHLSIDPIRLIKSNFIASKISGRTRQLLVTVQFFLCMAMVAGAFLSKKQVDFIVNKNLGFDSNQILVYPLQHEEGGVVEQYEEGGVVDRIKKSLSESSTVISVSGSDQKPMMVLNKNGSINWMGKADGEVIEFSHIRVDYNFTKTLNIPVVAGRDFSKDILSDTANFLINESAAKSMGLDNPVGATIEGLGRRGMIVGVIKDFHNQLLYSPISPMVLCLGKPSLLYVKIANTGAIETMADIHKKYSPGFPFEYGFLDDEIEAMYKSEIIMSTIIDYFAALALTISLLGLLGLVSFSTQNRMKEIGVRKVFGASSVNIAVFLITDYLKIILVALIIAIPVVFIYAQTWLDRFSYAIELSWFTFIIPGLLIILISVIVIITQVAGASRTNPIKILRYE